MITFEEAHETIRQIHCPPYELHVWHDGRAPDRVWWLQVRWERPDVQTGQLGIGYGRCWLLWPAMANVSEVARTALAACLAMAEHEVREQFLYKGQRVFGPHQDIDRVAIELAAAEILAGS